MWCIEYTQHQWTPWVADDREGEKGRLTRRCENPDCNVVEQKWV